MRHRETRVASHEYAVLRVGKGRVRASLCDAPAFPEPVIRMVTWEKIIVTWEKSLVNWPARFGHQRLINCELAAALTTIFVFFVGV